MASYDPIIRRNENLFRAPDKIQSKVGRKPLGDVTNSSKPLGKDKSSAKNFSVFKGPPEKVQPKATGRKPLGDLTNNSKRPQVQEKTSKNCTANISTIKEEQGCNWVKDEGFLHNHNECIKAQNQAQMMSMDYFLETVGLKEDLSTSPVWIPRKGPEVLEHKFEPIEFDFDMMDVLSPPSPSSRSPGLHSWIDLEFSPLKLKDSPVRM